MYNDICQFKKLNSTQNSCKKDKKFINSKLHNRSNPTQPKSQILFHKKIPAQDFIRKTLAASSSKHGTYIHIQAKIITSVIGRQMDVVGSRSTVGLCLRRKKIHLKWFLSCKPTIIIFLLCVPWLASMYTMQSHTVRSVRYNTLQTDMLHRLAHQPSTKALHDFFQCDLLSCTRQRIGSAICFSD